MAGTEKSGKSAVESGIRDPGKTSPIVVEKFLKGVSFPASKRDLIQQARNNNAPDTVMQLLNKIADGKYNGTTDVAKETAAVK